MKLREEFNKQKKREDEMASEAAVAWLDKNVVIINEEMNRKTVKRLISQITKFDKVFGPYKNKIPALASTIGMAEDGLEKVITGRANDKKASDMLAQLSFLYSTFSKFFKEDLPVVLSSHLFLAPKENPEVRLDVLQPKTGTRYDATSVRDAIKHALVPSKDNQKMLNKVYKKKNIPLIDANAIASQMLQLSYNELEELGKVSEVPMMAIAEPEAAPAVGESVDRNQKKDQAVILESHKFLFEITDQSAAQLTNIVDQIKGSMNIPGMEGIAQTLTKLVAQANKELDAKVWMDPRKGKAMKQLIGFYNLMDNFNQEWSKRKGTFAQFSQDGQLTPEELSSIESMFQSASKDNVFGSLAKAMKLKTPHAPGLEPNTVIAGIMAAAGTNPESVTKMFQKTQQMPGTSPSGEPKVGGRPEQAKGSIEPDTATGTGAASATGGATGTQGSMPGGESDSETVAQDIAAKLKLEPSAAEMLQGFIDNHVTKAGYKVVKA
jgi:hypothetical protein